MYYHFYYKEDSKIWSQETNINSTILGLKEGAGWGRMGEGTQSRTFEHSEKEIS